MTSMIGPRLARILLPRKTVKYKFRGICSTDSRPMFHEPTRKGYNPVISDYYEEEKNVWQQMCQGCRYLFQETKVWLQEIKEALRGDPMIVAPSEVDVKWRFQGDPAILEQFVVTCDSDYGEGKSTASLQLTKWGRGIFTGNLDPRQFNDGVIKRTGYCNIATTPIRKSFYRQVTHEWGPYTHIILRVRGDGRNYLLTLATPGFWDILWNDSFQYVLHTRGGPYWQYVRIPFSKFMLVSKGRVQDKQRPLNRQQITKVGITCADKIPGNFKLEIDYIGVEWDRFFCEEFAYEMYKSEHGMDT